MTNDQQYQQCKTNNQITNTIHKTKINALTTKKKRRNKSSSSHRRHRTPETGEDDSDDKTVNDNVQ